MTEEEELEMLRLRKKRAMSQALQPPAKQETPSLGATTTGAVHTARHLAGGLGDKIIAAEMALSEKLHDNSGSDKSFGDRYDRNLQMLDRTMEESDKQHEVARWVGNGLGFVGSAAAPLLRGGKAALAAAEGGGQALRALAGAGAREGAKAGGVYGAASGYGGSRAKSAGGTLLDTAIGTGLGAGGGALLGWAAPYAIEGGRRAIGAGAELLERIGLNQGRRVLQGGEINAGSSHALDDEVVRAALEPDATGSRAIRMGSTSRGAYERLDERAATEGRRYGEIVDGLDTLGVEGPRVDPAAAALEARAAQERASTGANKAAADAFEREAQNLRNVAPPRERSYLDAGGRSRSLPPARGERVGLRQNEGIKQSQQGLARMEAVKVSPAAEAYREISSLTRQGTEDAIETAVRAADPDSEIARLGSDFLPVKRRLALAIAGRDAAEKEAIKAAKRNGISLTDKLPLLTGGEPITAAALGLGNNLARNRGTSTVAAGSYRLAQALRSPSLQMSPGGAVAAAAPAGAAVGEVGNPLRYRFVGDLQIASEEEEKKKVRALARAAALRSRR